jgi:hypothetical protein
MTVYRPYDFDNRDSQEMYRYLEARIEAMRLRIGELEKENERLRLKESNISPFLRDVSKTA